MNNTGTFKYTVYTMGIAAILWYLLFVVKPMNFWVEMSLSILALGIMALLIKKDTLSLGKLSVRHIVIGVLSAAVLYMVFYAGNIISGLIFPFKDAQITSIYGNRAQGSMALIGLLLLFIIGPGEEIYWRGFIQRVFSERFGENKGYIIAALLYPAVHITTGNVMLMLAALVCGLYWGWICKREKSIIPAVISHALWDFAIFVLFPLK